MHGLLWEVSQGLPPFDTIEPERGPLWTHRGGNPVMANTQASEVRSGMFAPPERPADWLTVDRGRRWRFLVVVVVSDADGGGGGFEGCRGHRSASRPSRSWETSQLDFEPWRQNFAANTGGKLPNHVFHLSSLSQIPLQMFEQTAPLF